MRSVPFVIILRLLINILSFNDEIVDSISLIYTRGSPPKIVKSIASQPLNDALCVINRLRMSLLIDFL